MTMIMRRRRSHPCISEATNSSERGSDDDVAAPPKRSFLFSLLGDEPLTEPPVSNRTLPSQPPPSDEPSLEEMPLRTPAAAAAPQNESSVEATAKPHSLLQALARPTRPHSLLQALQGLSSRGARKP